MTKVSAAFLLKSAFSFTGVCAIIPEKIKNSDNQVREAAGLGFITL